MASQGGRSDAPKRFFSTAEQTRIVEAIRAAEACTSGEIRLHVERNLPRRGPAAGDPYLRARQIFAVLRMHETAERNGVLIYLATRAHRLAVVGDEELHQKVEDGFWEQVVARIASASADDRPADGLCEGIAMIGERLRAHFPHRPDDVNELSDGISF